MADMSAALLSLKPGRSWILENNEYSRLFWNEPNEDPPTEAELLAEMARLNAYEESISYIAKRKKEYPPVADYLDAVVKDDKKAIQDYIDACKAVKAKYPKPE